MKSSDTLGLANQEIVRITTINQRQTYDGLLEGLPTREMNERIIQGALMEAEGLSGDKPYLIEPEETPLAYSGDYPFGTPAQLPAVVCIARLRCSAPARDEALDYSALSVVWFQEGFAFPIEDKALRRLQDMKWSGIAHDFEY